MAYFTTAELRELPDMGDAAKYPDARLVAAEAWIRAIIDRECGTTFTPTAYTETLDGSGGDYLSLVRPYVQSVTAVSVGGLAYSAGDLTGLTFRHSMLQRPIGSTFLDGRANVTVTYTAGYSTTPPADLKEAALRAARVWVLSSGDKASGLSARATSYSTELGQVQLSTAGEGRPTGIPDVDAVIMGWASQTYRSGIA